MRERQVKSRSSGGWSRPWKRFQVRSRRRCTSRARTEQPEPAQREERGLTEAAALRQQRELDRNVVEVVEAARPTDVAVAQLEEVDAVDRQEAIARGQRAHVA